MEEIGFLTMEAEGCSERKRLSSDDGCEPAKRTRTAAQQAMLERLFSGRRQQSEAEVSAGEEQVRLLREALAEGRRLLAAKQAMRAAARQGALGEATDEKKETDVVEPYAELMRLCALNNAEAPRWSEAEYAEALRRRELPVDAEQLRAGIERGLATPDLVHLTLRPQQRGTRFCYRCEQRKPDAAFDLDRQPRAERRPLLCLDCFTWRHYFCYVAPSVPFQLIADTLLLQDGRCWASRVPLQFEFDQPFSAAVICDRDTGRMRIICMCFFKTVITTTELKNNIEHLAKILQQ